MNKVYFKCLCGSNLRLAKKLQADGYEIINLQKDRQRRAEAHSYKMKLPFIVKDEQAYEIPSTYSL